MCSATSDYLNRPLRDHGQVRKEYQDRPIRLHCRAKRRGVLRHTDEERFPGHSMDTGCADAPCGLNPSTGAEIPAIGITAISSSFTMGEIAHVAGIRPLQKLAQRLQGHWFAEYPQEFDTPGFT